MNSTYIGCGLVLSALVASAALAQDAPTQPISAVGYLTTHVFDTLSGKPGPGIRILLEALQGGGWRVVRTATTNADGRTDQPLLAGEAMVAGRYRIIFQVGEYYAQLGAPSADPRFLDQVPIDFAIADA